MRSTNLLLIAAICLFAALPSFALPQFAAEYKQSCQLCHWNPTGAGMRSLYGAQFFSYMELPIKGVSDFTKLDDIQPKIGKNLQVGFDFRSMYYTQGQDTLDNTFFTMEGSLYMAFSPSDKATLYIDRGLLGGTSEAFLLLQGLPMSGALRAGKFVPAYGWRFEDHKSFVREKLGFGQLSRMPVTPDNGVEFGFYPMEWEWSASLTNGNALQFDSDNGKAATTRAAVRFSMGDLNLTAGGSYRYSELGRAHPVTRMYGPLAAANWKGLTYLGEVDWMDNGPTSLAATHLLSYRIRKGVNISAQYDFSDPDLDHKTGSSWRGRLSSEIYLTGYLELIPAYEQLTEKSASGETKYSSGELQLHVWF